MKKRGVMVKGEGPVMQSIACGALVLIHSCDRDVSFHVAGRLQTHRMFQLPPDVDVVEVKGKAGCNFSLEWFPIKPKFEVPDPTPVALPVGAGKPESLATTIARLVRRQVAEVAKAEGFDPEEEEDFDDDDEDLDDRPTKYEYEEVGRRAEREKKRLEALQKFVEQKRAASARNKAPTPPAEPSVPPVSGTAPATGNTPSPK